MSSLKTQHSTLYLLVDKFAKSVLKSEYVLLSTDMVVLIAYFHGVDFNAFIVGMKFDHHLYNTETTDIMQILNVSTKQIHKTQIYFTRNNIPKYKAGIRKQCIANKCKLPYHMKNVCMNEYYNKLGDQPWLNTKQWNLIFHFGAASHITAFNESFYIKNKFDQYIYRAYNFKIPDPKTDLDIALNKSSYCYSTENQILYAFYQNTVCSLDLSNKISENIDDLQWKIWKDDTYWINHNASSCMVDNDKYIACMNGSEHEAYLYALNCKTGIQLKDMNIEKYRSVCMYHATYHKIVIAGNRSIEWYDINKDRWIIICNDIPLLFDLANIWYSPFNPNMLYIAKNTYDESLYEVDVRNGQYKLLVDQSETGFLFQTFPNSAYIRF